jgi:enoyl-CoA hydratase/carnithine racemase
VIPLGEALLMQLTAEPITAHRAYQIGLVQGLHSDRPALDQAVDDVVASINENSPLAVEFVKRVVKEGRDMSVDHQWKFSEMFSYVLAQAEDAAEGPRAFVEKRKPTWSGR